METYYSLLGVEPNATHEEITKAYQQRRAQYAIEHVSKLDEEFRSVATERVRVLDEAFNILSDAEQRRRYDKKIGIRSAESPNVDRDKARVQKQEVLMAVGGVVLGLLLIAGVWLVADRPSVAASNQFAEVLRPASDFTLLDLNGQSVQLSDYEGQIVMLNFWYSTCVPCREETPAIQEAYHKLADQGLVVLGVNVRQNEREGVAGIEDVQEFVDNYGVTYPVILDEQSDVGQEYQVYLLPTTIFIDHSGTERYRAFSAISSEGIEHIFMELQREAAALR